MTAGEAIFRRNSGTAVPLSIVAPTESAGSPADEPNKKASPHAWILNPVTDLLFCCGGLLWLMFALNLFVGKNLPAAGGALVLLTVAGTHILSESHTAATLERLNGSELTRTALSRFGLFATVGCSLLAVAGLAVPGLPAIFAKIYLIWIVQHFMAQSYGVALIYCYKRNYFMGLWEKRLFKFMIDATIVYGILKQFVFPEWSAEKFIGQTLPFWGPLPVPLFNVVDWTLKASIAAFLGAVILKFIRQKQIIPMPAALLILTSMAIFTLPKPVTEHLWMYVPAFFHGCQYLVVSASVYLKERGMPEGSNSADVGRMLLKPRTLKYFGCLFIGGIFIYVGIPGFLQDLGVDFKVAFATVFTVINFHHFMIDAAIWKLRDPKLRKLLIA
ncbi:MAG TPA: hypothetical protein V6C76_10220 [Drouetiella sp.]